MVTEQTQGGFVDTTKQEQQQDQIPQEEQEFFYTIHDVNDMSEARYKTNLINNTLATKYLLIQLLQQLEGKK